MPDQEISLTFIGHATWLISGCGINLVTDPVLSDRIAGIYPRMNAPALTITQLSKLDAVLISHPHLDHMDIPTLKQIDRSGAIIVPRQVESFAQKLNYGKTVPLSEWETVEIANGVSITATPAVHTGVRGWGSGSLARGAVGYIIDIGGEKIFFAGDTAYGAHFSEIGKRFRPRIALLPIGAYIPWFIMRWFHIGPKQALQAFGDLGADWFIPYHWGTFRLSLEPVKQPPLLLMQEAEKIGVAEKIIILKRGQKAIFAEGKLSAI